MSVDILIVEDNESDMLLMKEAIKGTAMQNSLFTVSSADEALAFLNKEGDFKECPRPDLIFMDLNMPGISGLDLLKTLKQDSIFQHIPVIILTTSSNENDISKCYRALANCYVVKPINFDRFKKTISVISDFWLGIAKLPPKNT